MKHAKKITTAIVLIAATFASCKKNYTCTCTTVIGTVSNTEVHNINDAYHSYAQNTCNNYQTQANNTLPGGTTCHL